MPPPTRRNRRAKSQPSNLGCRSNRYSEQRIWRRIALLDLSSYMDVGMSRLGSVRLASLPCDGSFLRVSWFGSVAFPARGDQWSQASIQVALSRCVDAAGNYPVAQGLDRDLEQQRCWVSIGALSLLRIGDIWSNGALASTPEYEVATFPDVLIDPSSSSTIKAGLEIDSVGFLLPFEEHPWHKGDTHSKCVLVDLPDNRQLVVPCIEIIRFYFGSSSDLLSRLFHVPLSKSDLFVRADHSISGLRMELDLADGIPRASASDVARIAGDPIAWRAAESISISCARAHAAKKRAYPSTNFPFRGRTDLVASGKWLGQDRRTFLVYSLRSCSHAFPFRTLRYRLGAQTLESIRRRSAASSGGPSGGSSSPSNEPTIRDRDPSARLARSEWLIARFGRFPDLERKSISKDGCHAHAPAQLPRRRSADEDADLALGIGVGSGRIRPLTLSYVEKTIKSAPPFLRGLLEALQALHGMRLTHLTSDGEDGWTVNLPLPRLGSGDAIQSDLVARRVSGFALEHPSSRWFVIVAIEDSPVTTLLGVIPTNAQGEVIPGAPSEVRERWASFLRSDQPDQAIDPTKECRAEFTSALIREHIAAAAASDPTTAESWRLLAHVPEPAPVDSGDATRHH